MKEGTDNEYPSR